MSIRGVRVANAPVSWGILEVGEWGDTPYDVFLDTLSALGYEGTELGPPGYLPANPEVLARELEKRKLGMAGAFVPVSFTRWSTAELERVATTARFLAASGSQRILIADGGEPGRRSLEEQRRDGSGLIEQEWNRMADALRAIADVCERIGLRVSFHHHIGSFVESPEEIERLLDITAHTSIDLCFDTGHLIWAGGDVLRFAQAYGHRFGHLHLKDVDFRRLTLARESKLDFVTAVQSGIFVPLGDGAIDFEALFDILGSHNYHGWIVVEQDRIGNEAPADALPPDQAAQRSLNFLRHRIGITAETR